MDGDGVLGGAFDEDLAPLPPPNAGALSVRLAEQLAEVSLIGEAATQGDLRKGHFRSQQQEARALQAAADDVDMGCLAEGSLEGSTEVGDASLRNRCQVLYVDRLVEPLIDKGLEPADLPRREPPQRDIVVCCAGLSIEFDSKEGARSGDSRFGRLLVTIDLRSGGFQQPREATC